MPGEDAGPELDAGDSDVTGGDAAPPSGDAMPADLGCDERLVVDGPTRITRELRGDSGACTLTLVVPAGSLVQVSQDPPAPAPVVLDGVSETRPGWIAPTVIATGEATLRVARSDSHLAIDVFGPLPAAVDRARALVWTDGPLLSPTGPAGIAALLAAISTDGHGGLLLRAWFDRFASTPHSERPGPALLLDDFAATAGADPSAWPMEALPFEVSAVHNRIDLASADPERPSCGELRVSLSSTHPVLQPLNLIFLFRQVPGPADVAPDGTVHCAATAHRWASLSALEPDAFAAQAAAILAETLDSGHFLLAESEEATVSPWEWRQWRLLDGAFENVPLFQSVDTATLNQPGPARDDLLAFVEANAAALDARALLLPERFRPLSTRVAEGMPWVSLSLDGVAPEILALYPDLRRNIEIVGCAACHATDATFVQSRPGGVFSPFYDKELAARAEHLIDRVHGRAAPVPFGPLQAAPLLPP